MPTATPFKTINVQLDPSSPCLASPITATTAYFRYGTLADMMNHVWNVYSFDLDFSFEITDTVQDTWKLDYDAITYAYAGGEPKDRICGPGNNIIKQFDGLSSEFELERSGSTHGPHARFFSCQVEDGNLIYDGSPTAAAAVSSTLSIKARNVDSPNSNSVNMWEIVPEGGTPLNTDLVLEDTVSLTIGSDTFTGDFYADDNPARTWVVTSFNFNLQFGYWTY